MKLSSGTITGLLAGAATLAGLLGKTNLQQALSNPSLPDALIAFGAVFSAVAGLLPGYDRA